MPRKTQNLPTQDRKERSREKKNSSEEYSPLGQASEGVGVCSRRGPLVSGVLVYSESDQKSFSSLHIPIPQKSRGTALGPALADAVVGRKWPQDCWASCLNWSLVVVSFM